MSEQIAGRWRHIENHHVYDVLGTGKTRYWHCQWVSAVFYRNVETGELFSQEISESEWHARYEFVGDVP